MGPMMVMANKDEYLKLHKEKYDAYLKLSIALANFLGEVTGKQTLADNLAMSLKDCFTIEISSEIEMLEREQPAPIVSPMPGPNFAPPPFNLDATLKNMSDFAEKAERLSEHLKKIRETQADALPEMQSQLQAAIAYLENEQESAVHNRDWYQAQVEAHSKIEPTPKEGQA